MEKKEYEKPEIQVIELVQAPQLLAGSNQPFGKNYNGQGR